MASSPRPGEVRGARDLVALWRALPAAVLCYPAAALTPGLGLGALSDTLRARAWREHCAAPTLASCADLGQSCVLGDGGRCLADALFPMKVGGGAPSWRMATLAVQYRPALAQLRLVALGETACGGLGWAARCLHDHHRLAGGEPLEVATLADLERLEFTGGARRWRLRFVTPWLVEKNPRGPLVPPDGAAVAVELRKAIGRRAHKLTALCLAGAVALRLGSHLVHHVAAALLPRALAVEEARVEAQVLGLASRGNAARFDALCWSGEVALRVAEDALPWLGLVATCGGGENADKGFGGVELTPLD